MQDILLDSVIGKSGLEALYEKQLRGQNGYTILIEDEDGQQKSVLAYQNKTDGETLRLTVDITLHAVALRAVSSERRGLFCSR
ncbi:MAG: hypothetical protein ACLUUO_15200 [Sellimonas intestinalis]